ncbi:hypothetical protein ANN_07837 [Periplaneta americana]|uniref:Uncharacterized protein n=1 Tax=Periplaneta americana TaxID=6978 RepID=A0ABQ8SZS6_PERAM|nr:hypothetical protein ANN_07837 [Periplaneta americana]
MKSRAVASWSKASCLGLALRNVRGFDTNEGCDADVGSPVRLRYNEPNQSVGVSEMHASPADARAIATSTDSTSAPHCSLDLRSARDGVDLMAASTSLTSAEESNIPNPLSPYSRIYRLTNCA